MNRLRVFVRHLFERFGHSIVVLIGKAIVSDRICSLMMERMVESEERYRELETRTYRIIQAGNLLHEFMIQLGQDRGFVGFTCDPDVAGAELIERAFTERLAGFRAAVTGVYHKNEVNCTDYFSGEEMWEARATHETLH